MPRRIAKSALSCAAVVAVATTALALSPASAYAGTDIGYIYTTNGSARGYFQNVGEHLWACDEAADGKRAITFLYWNGAWRGDVEDTDGANGNCNETNLSIVDGTSVWLEVCIKNGTYGALEYCSPMIEGKA
jgi:hypothetical protein